MSLTEVLSASSIGGFVLASAITMLVVAMNSTARTTDKVNAVQQGRIAMTQVRQRINSQTCLFPPEFTINGVDPAGGGQPSILYASPTRFVFIGDLSNSGGATNVAGSVGFRPQIRHLYVDIAQQVLFEGWSDTTNTTMPYNFSINPNTSPPSFAGLATTTGLTNYLAATQTVTRTRAIANPVVPQTTTAGAQIPYIRYYNATGTELAMTGGVLLASQFGEIARISLTFRVIGNGGEKTGQGSPDRTAKSRSAGFTSDFYLRTAATACT